MLNRVERPVRSSLPTMPLRLGFDVDLTRVSLRSPEDHPLAMVSRQARALDMAGPAR